MLVHRPPWHTPGCSHSSMSVNTQGSRELGQPCRESWGIAREHKDTMLRPLGNAPHPRMTGVGVGVGGKSETDLAQASVNP